MCTHISEFVTPHPKPQTTFPTILPVPLFRCNKPCTSQVVQRTDNGTAGKLQIACDSAY